MSYVPQSTDPAQYAQFLLESYANINGDGSASLVEDSLGSYVISLLQEESEEESASREALVELLQEHCSLSEQLAGEALDQIQHFLLHGEAASTFYSSLAQQETPTSLQSPISPLHEADVLIPGDLFGVLDVETPQQYLKHQPAGPLSVERSGHTGIEQFPPLRTSSEEEFPPLHAASKTTAPSTSKKAKATRGRKSTSTADATIDAAEVATALFRPRSRQNSIDESARSASISPQPDMGIYHPQHQQHNVPTIYDSLPFDSAVEIVLSMNPDLSEEAAGAACMSAHNDLNLAQYLVEQAVAAPAVCRHLLASGCYRADCQYSHDLENHTCLFWLRGRCGKGTSCMFKHGFNEALLEQLIQESKLEPAHDANPLYLQYDEFHAHSEATLNSNEVTDASSVWEPSVPVASSFANVAKGQWLNPGVSVSRGGVASSSSVTINAATVKIPIDVWTPHESRDSSVFHVADPVARYEQVQSWSRRDDVIDLHFQSTKTFPIVLSSVLPEKLAKFSQVWIVTGTGHHVGTKTHQKGGGALENSVAQWLQEEGYSFFRGRDRNGQGGALLVERR